MPSACVAAAATGLPEIRSEASSEPPSLDLHLTLCRLIGDAAAEEAALQKSFDGAESSLVRARIERAMDDTYDRRNALMMALSAEQARTLGAAAAQMAAACNMFSRLIANQEPDLEAERAIERLIQSASLIISREAGLSEPELAGISSLFEPQISRWRETIAVASDGS